MFEGIDWIAWEQVIMELTGAELEQALMENCSEKPSWYCRKNKVKAPTISDIIQSRREEGRPFVAGELREGLLQREMARHNFTREQALVGMFAFSRDAGSRK